MTRRRVTAIFIAWHLFAISVAALPPPSRLSHFPPRDPSSSQNALFYRVTVALDTAARGVEAVERGLWWLTHPLHPAVTYYLAVTGLNQNWSMFANPPTSAQYMRVRYYVQPDGGRAWVATELVLPSGREDRVRTVQSFRDSYRDKAIAVSIGRFNDRRKASLVAPDTRPEQLPPALAPIARYFSREFARKYLTAGNERIVRTEVWIGTAPIPRIGTTLDDEARLDRAVALQAYYDGPIEQRLDIPP